MEVENDDRENTMKAKKIKSEWWWLVESREDKEWMMMTSRKQGRYIQKMEIILPMESEEVDKEEGEHRV